MREVSVIIPVYNTLDYLENSINSVLNQTYKEIDIIIVNDGSNAEVSGLLTKIAKTDGRIKVYHFEQRRGVSIARNFGIQQAEGEFIYFFDSDDYLHENAIELLVNNIYDFDIIRGMVKHTNFHNSFAMLFHSHQKVKMFEQKRFNLIKNKSVLNFLIRKTFIEENQFSFDQDIHVYSDLTFMIPILLKIEVVPYIKEAVYFKRIRNAPIKNPSLKQSDLEIRIPDFLNMYKGIKNKYSEELLNAFIDKQFLNFYKKDILSYIKHNEYGKDLYTILSDCAWLVSKDVTRNHNFILRRELAYLKKGNEKSFRRLNNRLSFLRDLRAGYKSKVKFYNFIYNYLFLKLKPRDNIVLFESFQGKSYSDNPKYIYEYMKKMNMNYKYIWSVNEKLDIPYNPKQVRRLSLRYFYYLARAKSWVLNSRLPNYIQKSPKHMYLQTWHGTPLKRLAGDMDDVHMPGTNAERYKRNFHNETQKWDYLISPNGYSSDIFSRAFWFEKEMMEVGYPRNDILYERNQMEYIKLMKQKMQLPQDKKIILYAPTWRDDEFYKKGRYKFDLQLNLQKVRDCLGEDYIIVLRMHYFIATQIDILDYKDFVFDFSFYDDIGELYLVSDILITDYSSVFFDYANLQRPILFYTYDIDKYKNALRGFYIDMECELPGPLLMNTEQVIQAVEQIDTINDTYATKYEEFYDRFCGWEDGKAAKRVVNRFFS